MLVSGGCRSGKSRFALNTAEQIAEGNRLFLATSRSLDEEMKDRVNRHRQERGPGWRTVESPVRLSEAVNGNHETARVILIDCITMWISNLLLDEDTSLEADRHLEDLKAALTAARCPIILVTNEVGMGIVPENRLAREFRDLAGSANQALAGLADQVVLVVSGVPLWVKGEKRVYNQ
jgi:adenosylcobinamide kinase / adenosylcobinamide-phosphate guanylyltransferase